MLHTPQFLPFQRYTLPIIWLCIILLAPLSFARSALGTGEANGAIDLHPYWYYGHFVRMGVNPYPHVKFNRDIEFPAAVSYVDGSVVGPDEVFQAGLAYIPTHTASTLLLIAPFSYLPWNLVKPVWFILNLLLVLAMPWMALRLLPSSLQLVSGLQWLVALSFYAMRAPRAALINGQPSIFIFFLMLLTLLLRQKHWFWAGLALGIAVGKYSIALPVVLFLLCERRFRVLMVAGVVQVVSLLAISSLQGGTLWGTIEVYLRVLMQFSGGGEGSHLGYLLQDYPLALTVSVVVGTLITGWMVVYTLRRGLLAADLLPLNGLLALWTLLAAYHRVYDVMLAIFFMIVCLSALTTWRLPTAQANRLGVFWAISLLMLCLPTEIVKDMLAVGAGMVSRGWLEALLVYALIGMWGVSLSLMRKVPRVNE